MRRVIARRIAGLVNLRGDDRKELAAELGYEGPLDGSADMNIRLHRAVMRALAVNGGKVPPQMLD